MEFISKIKNNPHPNDLGYDEVINLKQEERAIWYEGKSDKIQLFYLETRGGVRRQQSQVTFEIAMIIFGL